MPIKPWVIVTVSVAAVAALAFLPLPPVSASEKQTIVSFVRPILFLYDPETASNRVGEFRRSDYEQRDESARFKVEKTLPSGAVVISDGDKRYGVRRAHVVTSADAAAKVNAKKDCNKVAAAAVDSGANRAFASGC